MSLLARCYRVLGDAGIRFFRRLRLVIETALLETVLSNLTCESHLRRHCLDAAGNELIHRRLFKPSCAWTKPHATE